MASLALGAVGGWLFGPIGFLVGSAIGNMLFPQKQEGPRLSDLSTQTSAYGEMLPIVYGKMRMPAKIFWADELVEHRHSSGGKGGPQVTTFTYTCSFYCGFCDTATPSGYDPIVDFTKLWFDKQVVWDAEDENTPSLPMTFYYGDGAQTVDSTMEAVLGAGNVPAYRGIAGIVFEDLELADSGNRIPNVEALVLASGGDIPWRVSTFNPMPDGAGAQFSATYADGVFTVSEWYTSGSLYYEHYFDSEGNLVGSPSGVGPITLSGALVGCIVNAPIAVIGHGFGNPATWAINGIDGVPINNNPADPGNIQTDRVCFAGNGCLMNDFIYVPCQDGFSSVIGVARYPCPDGIPGGTSDAFYPISEATVVNSGTLALAPGDNGKLLVSFPGLTTYGLYEFEDDLTLSRYWTNSEGVGPYVPASLNGNRPFVSYRGMFANVAQAPDPGNNVYAVRIGSGTSGFTQRGTTPAALSPMVRVHRGLCVTNDGIVSLDPPDVGTTLGDIVGDVSLRDGLQDGSPSEYDVDDLPDIVPGYVIASQMAGRDAISPLQNAWPFDATERDGKVVFVRRGKHSIITIPQADLAAYADGGEPEAILGITRALEQDLPCTLNISYYNTGADYQKGSQYARRLITNSKVAITLDMAIAMDDTFASGVAAMLLWNAWWSRNTFAFFTSVKYAYLEPTDIITIATDSASYVMRITKKTEQTDGVFAWEAIADDPSIWLRAAAGSGGVGQTPPVITSRDPSILEMLDIPLLADADEPNGPYVAMASSTGATSWSARYFKSIDGGTTYVDTDGTSTADIIGESTNAIAAPEDVYTFDESNQLTVLIGAGGGTLASVSRDDALAGAFAFLLGEEIIYGRDATLTAPSTYDITGMLRGRRGTDWAVNTHTVGERFVVLPPSMNPGTPFGELGLPVKVKGVTRGTTVASAATQDFTNTGKSLKPYSPVQIGGGPNAGGDIVINWIRRTRIGGQWTDGVDAPLSEATELYVVEFYDSTNTICGSVNTSTTQTYTYTAAHQITDFGSTQAAVYVAVGQVGAYGIGARRYATIPGGGVYISAPLTPTPRYADPPSKPPPGPSAPVDFALSWPVDTRAPVIMTVGQRFVASFTTAGTTPSGHISLGEYSGPTITRHAVLATDTGGLNRVVNSEQWGTTITMEFSGLGILPSTTYYFIFDFLMGDGSYTAPVGSNGNCILSLLGV